MQNVLKINVGKELQTLPKGCSCKSKITDMFQTKINVPKEAAAGLVDKTIESDCDRKRRCKNVEFCKQHFVNICLLFSRWSEEETNVVYKIICADCNWSYIGETRRSFLTRRKEHERNIKNFARGSNVTNHTWKHDHNIDFKNASIIDKGHYRIWKALES